MFLHDRIHEAAHKNDLRETYAQFFIDSVQVASKKMMQTDSKKEHCFWFLF